MRYEFRPCYMELIKRDKLNYQIPYGVNDKEYVDLLLMVLSIRGQNFETR